MSGFYGVSSKLLIGTASGTPSVPIAFQSESLARRRTIFDANALAGTLSRFAARARPSVEPVGGSLLTQPTAVEMQTLLPWLLGGTPSGTNYPLGETAATKSYWVVRGAQIFKYPVVGVTRGTFSASQGEALHLGLDLVGTTEDSSAAASGFPSFTEDNTAGPWMLHELVLTVAGSARKCRNITVAVDNGIDGGRFFNSQFLQSVQATDRHVTVSHDLPYGDEGTAYALTQAGVAVTAVFTHGVYVLTLSMPLVQYEEPSPVVSDRGEVMLRLTGQARANAAPLDELAVTLATS